MTNSDYPKIAIIVAGGVGKRMNSLIPKQFIEVNGKPVLMFTVEKFFNFDNKIEIVIVLPADQILHWENLCEKHSFKIPHRIVKGGNERFYSVKNGLQSITHLEAIVAIHDGVRPLVSHDTIKRCFENVTPNIGVIPVISVVDSLREINDSEHKHVNRNNYKAVQTPQTFYLSPLLEAYSQDFTPTFTDDASVFESSGRKIKLIDGNVENIKITEPIDILFMNAILQNNIN